jgi:hypothetical protein
MAIHEYKRNTSFSQLPLDGLIYFVAYPGETLSHAHVNPAGSQTWACVCVEQVLWWL